MNADSTLFDANKPAAIERLARIDGESNFLSLLAGIEAGKDTTQDMAALAFSRRGDVTPEILEAYVARSELFRVPLMSIVFHAILKIDGARYKAKDYPWIQGAVADAFGLIRVGECKPQKTRAKQFCVDEAAYSGMRKIAHGVFLGILDRAEQEWKRARFSTREISTNRYSVVEDGEGKKQAEFGRASGCYRTRPLDSDDKPDSFNGHGIGVADNIGWNDREADRPAPVTIHVYAAQPTAPLDCDSVAP